jgi:hypothetical protein
MKQILILSILVNENMGLIDWARSMADEAAGEGPDASEGNRTMRYAAGEWLISLLSGLYKVKYDPWALAFGCRRGQVLTDQRDIEQLCAA